MPELLEIEMYRRAARSLVGRTFVAIDAPDDWYLKGVDAVALSDAVVGSTIEAIERKGKLMIIETSRVAVGLRFGMTGRLVIDEQPAISELEYSSKRLDPAWDRFVAHFVGGGSCAMNDPRRLGAVELSPDLTALGPDAWSLSDRDFAAILARYRVAIKALLLNQKRIAGLGNLLVDELLWRCAVAPSRPANQVGPQAVARMAAELAPMLTQLYARGGSNCGDLFPQRAADGHCPRDGAELSHGTVGGRSTWWCPEHQH